MIVGAETRNPPSGSPVPKHATPPARNNTFKSEVSTPERLRETVMA